MAGRGSFRAIKDRQLERLGQADPAELARMPSARATLPV